MLVAYRVWHACVSKPATAWLINHTISRQVSQVVHQADLSLGLAPPYLVYVGQVAKAD